MSAVNTFNTTNSSSLFYLADRIDETNATSDNLTNSEQLPKWTLTPIFFFIVCILGTIGNSIALILFFRSRHSRTPFDLYVINLLSANLVCLLVQYPMSVITNLYVSAWYMGNWACTLFLYCQIVLGAGIVSTHALIAINRTWAIVHPISYRSVHTTRFSLLTIVGMWVYVHLVMGSFVIGTEYHRVDILVRGCIFPDSTMVMWSNVTDVIVYIIPVCIIMLSFPIVLTTRIMQRRQRANQGTGTNRGPVVSLPIGTLNRNRTGPVSSANNNQDEGAGGDPQHTTGATGGRVSTRRGVNTRRYSYHVLGFMTACATICYAPLMVYFLLAGFKPGFWHATVFQVVTLSWSCQTIVDPVFFTFALERQRTALVRVFLTNH